MSEVLQKRSILLIGERHPNRIVWVQFYSTYDADEESLRNFMLDVKRHVLKGRIKHGSARKFQDGKLLFYEIDRIPGEITLNKLFCLYTEDTKIGATERKALETIAYRGGAFSVYSAKRFFSEMIDLLQDTVKLNQEQIPLEEAITRVDALHLSTEGIIDVNELGQLISLINRSIELTHETLEKLYFVVYESIEKIHIQQGNGPCETDPDEFLDAAYLIARKYQETDTYYLALELFKMIIPVAISNARYDLEMACRVKIATIYKDNFPNSGEFILETLENIDEDTRFRETSQTYREQYHCLMGHAHQDVRDATNAIKQYQRAIDISQGNISSPMWIADAYHQLGNYANDDFMLTQAVRSYLTAATISFAEGDLTQSDYYQDLAASAEIHISYSFIHTSMTNRMEGANRESEYRAWDALRLLIRSFIHSQSQNYFKLKARSMSILKEAERVLSIPGKTRRNKSIIRRVLKTIRIVCDGSKSKKSDKELLEEMNELIDDNIPIPPPTFMLLSVDGRLITMGEINRAEWMESNIEGVILSGILTAIMLLISEVSEQQTSLRTVDAGNFQIMIEQSEEVVAVILADRDIPEFRVKLIEILQIIDESFGDDLRYWDGSMEIFDDLKGTVVELFSP